MVDGGSPNGALMAPSRSRTGSRSSTNESGEDARWSFIRPVSLPFLMHATGQPRRNFVALTSYVAVAILVKVTSGSSSVVECFLAKEDVAGSTPVSRSNQRLSALDFAAVGLGQSVLYRFAESR